MTFVDLTPAHTHLSAEELRRTQGEPNQEVQCRFASVKRATTAITDVVFDFGEVLVHWDPAGPLSSRFDEEMIRQFRDNDLSGFDDANAVSDNGESLEDAVAQMTPHPGPWAEMMRFYLERFDQSLMGEIPGARQLIEDLHQAGYRCWGLSNWSPENFYWVPRRYPIIHELDGYLVSGFIHQIKPNRDIFETASHTFGYEPEHAVFIDDKPSNVQAARDFGMGGIVQRSAQQVREDLIAMGVNIPAVMTSVEQASGFRASMPSDCHASKTVVKG
ncbi:HAD family hydrolase [Aeriscardovia aeriphila]|uniref:Haloacid dehalogenase n=1 Tax=Aeriscardovia aeriphila TaxID=218139 RepID=A0A261FAZ3_9BIFI|nr:HAD family phosphatase [Aeriscardovia aeriphila]NYI25559.1 putative hydrolase of the HAD superfamily [Aeriscardovia aeriphila]OZG56292.1 haloacid dehalogenase [Aeriscardovia aeriphila]